MEHKKIIVHPKSSPLKETKIEIQIISKTNLYIKVFRNPLRFLCMRIPFKG